MRVRSRRRVKRAKRGARSDVKRKGKIVATRASGGPPRVRVLRRPGAYKSVGKQRPGSSPAFPCIYVFRVVARKWDMRRTNGPRDWDLRTLVDDHPAVGAKEAGVQW